MPFLDGHPGPYILLALSVALAAYNVLFLHNLFRSQKETKTEESKKKAKKIIDILKPQVPTSLFLMFVLILRIIVKPFSTDSLITCIDGFALLVLLVLWFYMCLTAWVSYLAGKSSNE